MAGDSFLPGEMGGMPTDPTNPYLPSGLQTLGMMLGGLGSGISQAGARNQPFYMGISPGAQAFQNSYYPMVQRGLQYDLQRKNYDLNASYKQMQEKALDIQTKAAQQKYAMGQKLMGLLGNGGLGGGGTTPPGIRVPQPLMGPSANNIGNVRPAGQTAGFQQPPTLQDGIILTQNTLKAYPGQFNNGQPMTIAQIGQHWAPPNENDTGAWVKNVSTISGLDPNQPLNLNDPATMAAVTRGIHGAEKGQGALLPVGDYRPGTAPSASGMPQFPGPPPDTSGVQVLSSLAGFPGVGQAVAGRQTALQKYLADKFSADMAARKERFSEANNPVTFGPDGQPIVNPTVPQAAGAKAAAEEQAKAKAHTDYAFPPGIDDPNRTPDQKLALLPRNIRGVVKEMGPSGDLALSDLPTRMASSGLDPSKVDIVGLTRAIYGDQFDLRQREAEKEFLGNIYKQSTPEGGTRAALITGIQHLNTFASLVKAQANGDTPAINAIVKGWNDQTGNPRFSGADALMQFLAPEAAKVVKGGNQLNEKEVEDNKEQLLNTKSWPQASTILQTWLGAMLARKKGLEDTARSLGVPDSKIGRFWGTGAPGPDGKPQPSAMTKAINDFYATTGADQVHGPATAQQPQSAPLSAPSGAVNMLKMNPSLRDQFDAKYGAGSAAKVLGK